MKNTKIKGMKRLDTKQLVVCGVLCAVAYALAALIHLPLTLPTASFLSYDPKDVVVAFGGFVYGPFSAILMSAVVALIEFVTIGSTGWIGLTMDFLSTAAFACSATLIYKYRRNLSGAIIGLAVGVVFSTAVMLLLNYIFTPMYTPLPREEIAKMLVTTFLPFNLIKYSINAVLTMAIYRPLTGVLRKAHMLPASDAPAGNRSVTIWVYVGCTLLLAGLIAVTLYMLGKI